MGSHGTTLIHKRCGWVGPDAASLVEPNRTVRYPGKTGSEQRAVKLTRLTLIGHLGRLNALKKEGRVMP